MTPTRDINDLLEIMRRLRDPNNGCPWDLEQNYDTIKPHTIEEAYEVADAIERKDFDDLKSELGDLLFQPIYYAQMAKEEDRFDFGDVVFGISEKLIRRHPHVFGEMAIAGASDVNANWETIKAAERAAKSASDIDQQPPSALDDVPRTLPALTRANKLSKRAARVGFDWPTALKALEKVREETEEVATEIASSAPKDKLEEEIGDLLFALANVARKCDIEPEEALNKANAKFIRRFHYVENRCREDNVALVDAGLERLDCYWNEIRSADK